MISRLLLGALLLFACGSPPPAAAPPPPPPPPPPPAAESVGIADSAWGLAASRRFSLVLQLPDREAWQVDDEKSAWFEAWHRPSRSELSAKTWRASRLARPEDCRRQLELWRPNAPKPDAQPESVIERYILDAPQGYATDVAIGVQRAEEGAEIEGWALALGHTVGECYAAIYTTRAAGKNAEAVVGERLALINQSVLPRVKRTGVEDRVK